MRPPFECSLAWAGLVGISIGLTSAQANAQSPPTTPHGSATSDPTTEIRATVVDVQNDELVLDLAASSGLVEGDIVELWRPLTLRHPVSRRPLEDRFVIGRLRLLQVRPNLTLARAVDVLSREARPGDLVIVSMRPPETPPPTDAAHPTAAPTPGTDGSARLPADSHSEEMAIGEMLRRLQGATIADRITAYEGFAARSPNGPYTETLSEEAAALRSLFQPKLNPPPTAEPPQLVAFDSPESIWFGRPITLGVELNDAAIGAVLHYRTATSPTFNTVPMKETGAGYFAATLPAEAVSGTDLQFFVEATDEAGAATSVLGDDRSPRSVDVLHPLKQEEIPLQRNVRVLTDYADYNRLRGDDRVWQTEGEFGMRFGDTGVRALRSGFGIYRGVGGSVEELDEQNVSPREVGLTYGYVETEVGPVEAVGIIGRVIVGLGDDGVAGGGQAMVRIGRDQGTNLVLGGELLGTVGIRSIAQLELAVFERVPIMFRTEVSNQPAGASPSEGDSEGGSAGDGDIGARGIAQVGLRIIDGLVVSGRGSFQGRTIQHAGPGFGGGVSYQW